MQHRRLDRHITSLGHATRSPNDARGLRWKNVKKKTDKEDALKLARLSTMGQLTLVHMPAKTCARNGADQASAEAGQIRTSIKNAIALSSHDKELPSRRGGDVVQEGLKWLENEARDFAGISEATELWRGHCTLSSDC